MRVFSKKYAVSSSILGLLAVWVGLTFSGYLTAFDRYFLLAFREAGDRSDALGSAWVENMVTGLTHIGDSVTLIALSLLALGWLIWKQQKSMAVWFLVTVGGVFAMTPLLKMAFGRARPDLVDHMVHASSASFPSGHTLRSAVVYLALYLVARNFVAFFHKKAVFIFVYGLFLSIGISRVYLGVHWPTDIVAGWLIAGAWLNFWADKLKVSVAERGA